MVLVAHDMLTKTLAPSMFEDLRAMVNVCDSYPRSIKLAESIKGIAYLKLGELA